MKNKKGLIIGIIVLIVVAAAGVGGYFDLDGSRVSVREVVVLVGVDLKCVQGYAGSLRDIHGYHVAVGVLAEGDLAASRGCAVVCGRDNIHLCSFWIGNKGGGPCGNPRRGVVDRPSGRRAKNDTLRFSASGKGQAGRGNGEHACGLRYLERPGYRSVSSAERR